MASSLAMNGFRKKTSTSDLEIGGGGEELS